jgi:SAM-dependent methyltransferase
MSVGTKSPLGPFLARNPFPKPYSLGFFFREKMRAIHRVAPDRPLRRILEIGGGQSGLTKLLYPHADVINIDIDRVYAASSANRGEGRCFVCANALSLPFSTESFDAVTAFDIFEHIHEDVRAASEAWRVLRPGGALLVSAPCHDWRYPFHRVLTPICPGETELFAEWGHVRRGYSLEGLETLVGTPCAGWATFISPLTALAHDLSFSRLPSALRRLAILALSPLTWTAYWTHDPHSPGSETAVAFEKPAIWPTVLVDNAAEQPPSDPPIDLA